jgi:Big-like domain-containing protein
MGALSCSSDLLLPDPPGGGENVAVSKVSGDVQVGTVGEQLLNPLVVQVLTERGLPAPGRKVEFEFASSAAEVTRDTAVTNDDGHAVIRWVLGTVAGSYTVRARMADIEGESQVAEFTAEAEAAAPDTVSGTSPLNQPGRRSQAVSTPPVVRVADRFGNPVGGVAVGWSVMSGEGVVSEPITETGEDGTTSVGWTLGGRVGVHRVTAAIGPVRGSPVTFTAVVLF